MRTDVFREQIVSHSEQRAFAEDFVLPDYQRLSVKNILPQIGAIFGLSSVDTYSFPKDYFGDFQGVDKVVLFIFDGFGYNRFLHHVESHDGTFMELAEKGSLKPLTTVFPATTSTVLTSLFTGLSPAQHQILGYHMFSKKYGLVFDTLDMKPVYGYSGQVELAKDYSHSVKSLLPILEQNGIKTLISTKASIAGSGLSLVTHGDVKLIPYVLASDMFTRSARALEQPGPTLLVIYYSGVDTLSHRYGPYSEEVTFELTSIEHNLKAFVSNLSEKTKKETLMLLTADHGVAETRKTFFLKDAPEVTANLMLPPVGDSRATFLYSKPNQQDALAEAFQKNVEGFKLFSSKELIDKNAFGQPTNPEELKEKVGDFTALGTKNYALSYPFFDDDRFHPMLGTHGGMTSEEIFIPFLSIKISEI
jgi:predicted AlkP superfamily pyrophosphatase or phosphodiesterase